MAETEKKISELTTASQINDTDLTILSQGSSGSGFASVKATILAIANKIVSGINFTSALQTTDKTITGAINEVAQGGGGGSSTLAGLSDVDIDTVTLDDGQGLVYDETEGKWVNGSASGGGHTIVDNSGTSLAQEPKLKLNGMYVHDDSANQTTVGEYYREMTTAQYNQLSAVEKQGAIRLTDNPYVCNINEVENADATHIPYDSNTSVKEKLDSMGYREVGRASLNQTFAQQLTQLKTAYDSLSGIEKLGSIIFTANQFFYLTNTDNGRAIYSSMVVGGAFACTSLDINNATMKYISGSFTVTDSSTSVNNSIMFLYVLDKLQ